jgi:hypothetical protein
LISVAIWATAAIVTREVSDSQVLDQTKMFVAGILSLCCAFFAVRIFLVVLRQKRGPIGKQDDSDVSQASGTTTYGSFL